MQNVRDGLERKRELTVARLRFAGGIFARTIHGTCSYGETRARGPDDAPSRTRFRSEEIVKHRKLIFDRAESPRCSGRARERRYKDTRL